MIHKYMILLIFFAIPVAQATDNLGRLFLTPELRAQLDLVRIKRDQRQPLTTQPEPPIAAAPAPKGPSAVTYSGVVRRSDGKSTVWINGQPVDERMRLSNERGINVLGMRSDGAVTLAIPQAARTTSLKVGQRLNVNSGRIEEAYERRETTPPLGENPSRSQFPDGSPVAVLRGDAASSTGRTSAKGRRESDAAYRDSESSSHTPSPSDKN